MWIGAVAVALLGLMLCPGKTHAQSLIVDRDISLVQKILAQRPNPELYYRLGDLYIQKGRQTGDIAYFNLSKKALTKALAMEPKLAPARRHLAFVLYSLHDFSGASSEAESALKLAPDDSYSYGVLGDAQLETGHYAAAATTYSRMVALKADLYSLSRLSGLETMRANNKAALADLKRAISDGTTAGEPPEGIAWAQVRLAQDYFLMGRLSDAAILGHAALKTYPNYHRALGLLGQTAAAQQKFNDAANYYRRAIAVIPLPQYAAALCAIYQRMGRDNDARQQHQLVEFIAHLNSLNRVLYNRVLVDYYADQDIEHRTALELAVAEFKTRQDIYGQDALAWALYRDGQAKVSLPHIRAAIRFQTTDARLYFHAGLIYAAVGDNDLARASLARALAINPHFQPILDAFAAHEYALLNASTGSQRVAETIEPQ